MRSISARPKLDQRRAHHGARQAAEQDQRFLHAVVHVGPRVGVKYLRQRIDAVVERARGRQVVARTHRLEELRLQDRQITLPLPERPIAAEHEDEKSQALWVVSTLTHRGEALQQPGARLVLQALPAQSLMARMVGTCSRTS